MIINGKDTSVLKLNRKYSLDYLAKYFGLNRKVLDWAVMLGKIQTEITGAEFIKFIREQLAQARIANLERMIYSMRLTNCKQIVD